MPFVPTVFPPSPIRRIDAAKTGGGMVKPLYRVGEFLRGMRFQMRYGELSRAPLHLLRFQIEGDAVQCDWIARAADPWDTVLRESIRQRHASLQALRDAIDMRNLVFDAMPQAMTACLSAYRESYQRGRELIIRGYARRNDDSSRNVHSLAMRAKVLGFTFDLEEDTLHRIAVNDPVYACR